MHVLPVELIDANREDGEITLSEFIEGAAKLRGAHGGGTGRGGVAPRFARHKQIIPEALWKFALVESNWAEWLTSFYGSCVLHMDFQHQ